jgi:hypothetical protein
MSTQETEISAALTRLRAVEKFKAEAFYPGAPNEKLRVEAEQTVNTLLDRLMPVLRAPADKKLVLGEFRLTLDSFAQTDTEERERLCGYLEEIMDIVGIESSDGLLNGWLYGFDPSAVDTASDLEEQASAAQVWSELDMQVYAYIEDQLAEAESRRDTLLGLPRGLQVFYLSLIVEAEVNNCDLRQFFINLSDYVDLIAPALRELPCEPAAEIFEQAAAERQAQRNPTLELDQQFRAESRNFPELRGKLLEKYGIRL